MQPPSDVQLRDAERFLTEHLGDGSVDIEYVGEGAWSRCFGFVHDGSELVVRFGRHLDDFQRDQYACRWASPSLPIPRVTEIGEVYGAWYAISTRAHGTPLEQLDPVEWGRTVPSVLAMLDSLHRADLSATTGYGPWGGEGAASHPSWSDYLAAVGDDPTGHRTDGWRQRLADSPTGLESFSRAYARMMDLADAIEAPRSLVHNDLLNRNVLATDGRVTAVFDWGCSIYGDFLYDLATLVFWSPWHLAIDDGDFLSLAKAHYVEIGLDVPDFEQRLRSCALHIGLQHLAYNAFLGDHETLRLTDERMAHFLGD